jgi:hypothetical protein
MPGLASGPGSSLLALAAVPLLLLVWLSGPARPVEALPSLMGEIGAYNRDSRALTLATPSGQVRLVLAPGAPVWQGARALAAEDLQALRGRQAKVRFSRTAAGPIARFVTVARTLREGGPGDTLASR